MSFGFDSARHFVENHDTRLILIGIIGSIFGALAGHVERFRNMSLVLTLSYAGATLGHDIYGMHGTLIGMTMGVLVTLMIHYDAGYLLGMILGCSFGSWLGHTMGIAFGKVLVATFVGYATSKMLRLFAKCLSNEYCFLKQKTGGLVKIDRANRLVTLNYFLNYCLRQRIDDDHD